MREGTPAKASAVDSAKVAEGGASEAAGAAAGSSAKRRNEESVQTNKHEMGEEERNRVIDQQ